MSVRGTHRVPVKARANPSPVSPPTGSTSSDRQTDSVVTSSARPFPYAQRNEVAPLEVSTVSYTAISWWPRPLRWRGLVLEAADCKQDTWRTPAETPDDPWAWGVVHIPFRSEYTWAAHLRLGGDRFYGRGMNPEEAFAGAIEQARWCVRSIQDALAQVGETLAP